jgi:hypothetical protein
MTTAVKELYEALRQAGVEDQQAMSAASAVVGTDMADIVTKQELRADLAELKADLIKWNVGTLLAVTGIFAAIVKLF